MAVLIAGVTQWKQQSVQIFDVLRLKSLNTRQ
jgi:hypothetical protein